MKTLFQRILLTVAILATITACGKKEPVSVSETKNLSVNTNALNFCALVIGISDYTGTGWPQLETAQADADAIGDVLEKQYGFRVIRLTDKNATRRNILLAFDSLMDFGPDDAVLVYFAGHGFYDQQMNEGYWIPYGAAQTKMKQPAKEDWLWNSTIDRIVSASPARHILLIADTCYGGSLFRGDEIASKTGNWYRRAMQTPSRYLITSGNLEPVLDSGVRHSVFAREILNYLQYADHDVFSASDLSVAIRENVSRLTGQLVRMGPLSSPAHAGGEFVFVRKDAPDAGVLLSANTTEVKPIYRNAPIHPKTEKTSRLDQLVNQLSQISSAESSGQPIIRPRILACLGPTGQNTEETALIRNRLSESLMKLGGCILVEREAFDDVLREFELSRSSLADTRVATTIGKLLPASLILFGEVVPADGTDEIHLRVIDTETSRVLASIAHPFSESDLPNVCRTFAEEIMQTVNQARPLLLPATTLADDRLETGWGRFHGARTGETFEIITRSSVDSVCPVEKTVGTATLLSATEEHSVLKAEWNTANRPAEVWLRATLHQAEHQDPSKQPDA